MAKEFEKDGVKYVTFTMHMPAALMDLLVTIYGNYGKSEKICELLSGLLAGVDTYESDLLALQSRHEQMKTLQMEIIESRTRRQASVVASVQRIRDSEAAAELEQAITEKVSALDTRRAEAEQIGKSMIAELYSLNDYDLNAPVSAGHVAAYYKRINKELVERGIPGELETSWIRAALQDRKSTLIHAIVHLEIPDAMVTVMYPTLQSNREGDTWEDDTMDTLHTIADSLVCTPKQVMDYILLRGAELGA